MRKSTKKEGEVEEICMYSAFIGSKATRYGILMDKSAWREYESNRVVILVWRLYCLVVSVDGPWLAAIPDSCRSK